MTFDSRAGRAAQGIRRAVEVMEMSSTKTPQRVSRFDQYRENKSRNQRIVALAVGIIVPVVLVVGAVRWLGSDSDQNVPVTTPSQAPSEPQTEPDVTGRSSAEFKAPFRYTVPADWTISGEGERYFSMQTPGAADSNVIAMSGLVAAAADCSKRPAEGVGTSSEAITSWLTTHPALDTTTPRPVTLGAATGSWVDIQLADDWNQTCPNGLFLLTRSPDGGESWEIFEGGKMRLYILDLPSGATVTIVIDSQGMGGFQSLIDEAAPVVESFRFLK
jgi:hypothetical protein